MNIGIYKSASAMVALDRWQEAISQNIASASVPGFKATETTFESKLADIQRYGTNARSAQELKGVMPSLVTQISNDQGQIKGTGNDTDFAIQGSGYFRVQLPKGGTGYTRDGEFHVNAKRMLVNKEGLPVLGENGPIALREEGGRLSMDRNGVLVQGDTAVGKLPVYQFKETDEMQRFGNGLLGPADDKAQPKAVQKPEILTGALEMSNVAPLKEMVNMISVSRAYESNQKVIQTEDDSMEKAIQSLGATS